MTEPFFPVTLPAHETRHFTSSAPDFREVFLKVKPDKLGWYAYDVIINSPTEVEFYVYGMRDNTYGGVGSIVGIFPAKVARKVTKKAINNRAVEMATHQRLAELAEEENKIIAGYAAKILKGIE